MKLSKGVPSHLILEEIHPGDIHQFQHAISQTEINQFANLVGDFNPIHQDAKLAQERGFESNVAHGMLVAGLFSRLIGMYCPGLNSLYLKQSLDFNKPIYASNILIVKGTVLHRSDITRIITLKTEVIRVDEIVVSGEAQIKML